MRARVLAALSSVGMLVAVGGCGSTSPAAPDSFEETSSTVQMALDQFTTGTLSIPAGCTGIVRINCPGGTPGGATPVTLTRSNTTIAQTATHVFSYGADLGVVSQAPIVVNLYEPSGGYYTDCDVAINTAPGTSPVVHVAGTATFTSQTVGGPIDELDFTTEAVTGLEGADFMVAGGGLCTPVLDNLTILQGMLAEAMENVSTRVCAGAGGTITTCP